MWSREPLPERWVRREGQEGLQGRVELARPNVVQAVHHHALLHDHECPEQGDEVGPPLAREHVAAEEEEAVATEEITVNSFYELKKFNKNKKEIQCYSRKEPSLERCIK